MIAFSLFGSEIRLVRGTDADANSETLPVTTEEFAVSYDSTNTKTIPAALTQNYFHVRNNTFTRARARGGEICRGCFFALRPPRSEVRRRRTKEAMRRMWRSTVRRSVLGDREEGTLLGAAAA